MTTAPTSRATDPDRGIPTAPGRRRTVARWAIVGVIGELTFTVAWMAGDAIAGPGYRPMRDDISDLGAMTATHPWIFLLPQLFAGLCAIGFALFALRPAIAGAGRLGVVGVWLSAASSIQDITDAVFRLPCRVADGCTTTQVTAGVSGQLHAGLGLLSLILSVASALVLACAFRRLPTWRDFVWPTVGVAALLVVAVFVVGSPDTVAVHGLAQRTLVVIAGVYGIWVAQRVYSLHAPRGAIHAVRASRCTSKLRPRHPERGAHNPR